MLPIKEVRKVKSWNSYIGWYYTNVCIDKKGRECVSDVLGYQLLSKDGKCVTKIKADF